MLWTTIQETSPQGRTSSPTTSGTARSGTRQPIIGSLASRGFRSTLARLAEWCGALGEEKRKDGRRPERIRPRHCPPRRPSFPLVRPAVRTIPFGQTAVTKGGGTGGCHRADGNGGTDRPNGIFGSRGQKLTKTTFFPIPSAKNVISCRMYDIFVTLPRQLSRLCLMDFGKVWGSWGRKINNEVH